MYRIKARARYKKVNAGCYGHFSGHKKQRVFYYDLAALVAMETCRGENVLSLGVLLLEFSP